MKSRYQNVTKLSNAKFRLLIKYFCKEFTALQIAELLHINRNTANLWIKRIRERIYLLVEQEKIHNSHYVQMDETYFTKSLVHCQKYRFPYEEITVFGVINEENKIYAAIIDKPNKREVFPIIQECCSYGATIYTDCAVLYKGLTKLGYQHYSVNHLEKEFSGHLDNTCITTNKIEGFWCWMKVRLAKFRGVKWTICTCILLSLSGVLIIDMTIFICYY